MNMASKSLCLLILLFATIGSAPVSDSKEDNNIDDQTRQPVEEPLFKKVYITPLCSNSQNKKYLYNCKTDNEEYPINYIDIGDLITIHENSGGGGTDQPDFLSTTITGTTIVDELNDQATTIEFEKTEDVVE